MRSVNPVLGRSITIFLLYLGFGDNNNMLCFQRYLNCLCRKTSYTKYKFSSFAKQLNITNES